MLTYWKVLSMCYCDMAAEWMPSKVLFDIGNVSIGSVSFAHLPARLIDLSGFLSNWLPSVNSTLPPRTSRVFIPETWIRC